MRRILLVLAAALLAAPSQAGELATLPDLKADAGAAAAVERDLLCHGPATLLVKGNPMLGGDLVRRGASRVERLSGAPLLVVEAGSALFSHLRASRQVAALHRLSPAAPRGVPDGLRAKAERPGGVAVIATLAVALPAETDEPARRAAIAAVRGPLLAALAPHAPGNVKTFDVSPLVAMTVDARGLDALIASTAVCAVGEDAINRPLGLP